MANSPLDKAAVERFLQDNPDFARDWFVNNTTPQQRNDWSSDANLLAVPNGMADSASMESESFDAVRELLGDLEEPAVKEIQARLSPRRGSYTSNMFQDLIQGRRAMKKLARKNRDELAEMSERELFMELIRDIASEMDVNILCHKILLNVSILTKSDRGSLFLVRGGHDADGNDTRYLVSKLFDVTAESSMEETMHTEENQIRVPMGVGIAGQVAKTKGTINIKNAYEDPRFNKEVDKQTGYRTCSLLCMPIYNYEGDVVGVAQIMNKTDATQEFTEQDEEVFRNYLTFCGIGLTNAQLFEMSVQEYKRNQMLLRLARGIFEEQQNLDNLVERIMLEAQDMLKCERCCVYLIEDILEGDGDVYLKHQQAVREVKKLQKPPRQFNHPEEVFFSKVFELQLTEKCDKAADCEDPALSTIRHPALKDVSTSKCADIAKRVACSGELQNISDTQMDPLTKESEVMDYDGFKVRNILSLPIDNGEKRVIGVVQLMNKCDGKMFTQTDINSVETFAIFCGLGIHNCQMYENACKLMAKQSVALEVLSYHAMAPAEEMLKLKNSHIPTAAEYGLYRWDFNDLPLPEDDTCKATLRMFLEMKVTSRFHVPTEVLCRWILSVKKNYRPVTYHNWRHAFNVAQTMFAMLYTGNMKSKMSELERFALVVACLCHDLDHRGTNNAFQSKVESPLAQLYSTSTMEHHHFDQCIMILNSEGNNIFGTIPASDYRHVIGVVEKSILSTDLALYFKKKGSFEELVNNGETDWKDDNKKELLRGMMMTACDVAAITKPWEIQKEIAQLVAGEFFEQGDLERAKLKEEPIAMMDRRKKDELPKMQVGFIDAICMPVYKLLATTEPHTRPLFEGCNSNREMWQRISEGKEKFEMSIPNEPNLKENLTSTESLPSTAASPSTSLSPVGGHDNTNNNTTALTPVNHTKTVAPPSGNQNNQQTTIGQTSSPASLKTSSNTQNLAHSSGLSKNHTEKRADPKPKHSAMSNGFRDPAIEQAIDANSKGSAKSHFCTVL